jgi:hypothetical protein
MQTQTKLVLLMVVIPISFLMLVSSIIIAKPSHAATFVFNKSNFHNPLIIDNKYFPLKPGTTFIYKGTKEGEPTRDTFQITSKVKEIAGISTREIRDNLYTKGVLTETTQDWFAQDDDGNVWYMGEFTTDFTNKENPNEGSWQAGVKGGKAGIIMEAQPKVGDTYQQEFLKGVAEDKATVLSLNEKICVPYGCFTNVLKTKESTPLEPNVVSNKYYAKNIGDIKEISVQGESEEQHLVQITGGDSSAPTEQQGHSKSLKAHDQPSQEQQQQQLQTEAQQLLKKNNIENQSSTK